MTKSKRKKRKTKISSLKAKALRAFSQYIRLRDSDENGYCTCVTCGKVSYWEGKGMSAGHFIQKKFYPATVFDERNCAPQCLSCNTYKQGMQWKFGLYLCDRYGRDLVDYLWELAEKPFKFTSAWLEEKTIYYRKEVDKLKSEKKLHKK